MFHSEGNRRDLMSHVHLGKKAGEKNHWGGKVGEPRIFLDLQSITSTKPSCSFFSDALRLLPPARTTSAGIRKKQLKLRRVTTKGHAHQSTSHLAALLQIPVQAGFLSEPRGAEPSDTLSLARLDFFPHCHHRPPRAETHSAKTLRTSNEEMKRG